MDRRNLSLTVLAILFLGVVLGCAQTMQPSPQPVHPTFRLEGLPRNLVKVEVRDLRIEKSGSEGLAATLQETIRAALSDRPATRAQSKYTLRVDVIECRAYFTLGNWNGLTRLRASLVSPKGETLGHWEARGDAHRSNLFGYDTAKAVANDAYQAALVDLLSLLSGVRVIH